MKELTCLCAQPGNHSTGSFRGCVFIPGCGEHYVILPEQGIKEADEGCWQGRERALSETPLHPDDSPVNPEPEEASDPQRAIDQPEFGRPGACLSCHQGL